MRSDRITESELVLPSLYLMSLSPTGTISTTESIRLLTQIMKPQGLDAQILSNRSDTYFSQKVRNLKSHNTLTKYGYALYSHPLRSASVDNLAPWVPPISLLGYR